MTTMRTNAVMMALNVMDAMMDGLSADDRKRVSHAFANKYANEISNMDAPTLTSAEWRVLRALAAGYGTGEMCTRLDMGLRTVNTHLQGLREKLNARNRAHTIAEAYKRGML